MGMLKPRPVAQQAPPDTARTLPFRPHRRQPAVKPYAATPALTPFAAAHARVRE